MTISEITKEVLKDIRPKESKILLEVAKFIKDLQENLKDEANIVLGGSLAKGTHMKDEFDVDIFVRFDLKFKDANISDLLEGAIKKLDISYERVHGSRDYFQIHNDIMFEVVPVLNVKSWKDAKNVADMSPLHVQYAKEKITKEFADEIRLTKAFMKAQKVYGAESYIKGFSGHVVDILILKYGSFLELLNKASKWKERTIIDVEKKVKDPLMTLNKSKILSPLIIIDPVQEDRNAAAALSQECYDEFIKRSKEFLKKPSKEFFIKKNIDEGLLKERYAKECVVRYTIKPLKGKKDVIGAKIMKIKQYLEINLIENDFEIIFSDWEFNEDLSKIIFVVKSELLSKEIMHIGPKKDMQEHVKTFKEKYAAAFLENDSYKVKIARKYRKPEELLKEIFKSKYVLERCKEINQSFLTQ